MYYLVVFVEGFRVLGGINVFFYVLGWCGGRLCIYVICVVCVVCLCIAEYLYGWVSPFQHSVRIEIIQIPDISHLLSVISHQPVLISVLLLPLLLLLHPLLLPLPFPVLSLLLSPLHHHINIDI
jgi:hypothetical protein